MGMKARDPREALTQWEKAKVKEMGISARVYKEMRKASWDDQLETPLRPFYDEKERLGARKCCDVTCSKPSYYVQYFLDISGRVALCRKHGGRKIEREMEI